MLRQLSLQHEPRQHSARAASTDQGPTRTRALLEAPGLHPARPAPVSESALEYGQGLLIGQPEASQ